MKCTRRTACRSLAATFGLTASERAFGMNAQEIMDKALPPQQARELLYSLLGDLPDRRRPIQAEVVAEEDHGSFTLERMVLDLNGLEPVPALLLIPKKRHKPAPAVLYNHSHGGGYQIGKKELLEGREYLARPPYAEVFAELGVVALCIDHWVFGERSHTPEDDMFKAMLWKGRVLWGMMVYDSLRALDYLLGRPEVDSTRVGTLGMSMGSTMAWWLAALDERVRVTIDLCCLTDFHALLERKALRLHGLYYYVPGLLKHFTTARINELIAPRPHLGVAGLRDPLTPPEGLDVIDRHLRGVYAAMGKPENWRLLRYDVAHQETPEARREVVAFLRKHLPVPAV
ncbi:MAG TPA: acetylxylan esterase [Acidobacteriota bacterium]|nr:acetylxylan esterase [Acidobacteriota bacterium]HRR25329.1 acetylxylan esterase [Acidobacteriota bacterium]HRR55494.1 acetylxylan esterase [Acidobacteriota bacterium]